MKVTGKLVDKTTPFMLKGMLRPHSVAAFFVCVVFLVRDNKTGELQEFYVGQDMKDCKIDPCFKLMLYSKEGDELTLTASDDKAPIGVLSGIGKLAETVENLSRPELNDLFNT